MLTLTAVYNLGNNIQPVYAQCTRVYSERQKQRAVVNRYKAQLLLVSWYTHPSGIHMVNLNTPPLNGPERTKITPCHSTQVETH